MVIAGCQCSRRFLIGIFPLRNDRWSTLLIRVGSAWDEGHVLSVYVLHRMIIAKATFAVFAATILSFVDHSDFANRSSCRHDERSSLPSKPCDHVLCFHYVAVINV